MKKNGIFSYKNEFYSYYQKGLLKIMIERHHLMIIQAIHKTGTLTAAADELCLTQSALSHSIKKLEAFLKTDIFVKNGRKLVLTQTGSHILGFSNRILSQFSSLELMISYIAKGQKGVLRIGMECHPCYQWLLKIVAPYLDKWRDVDLDVIQKFQFGGVGALLNYDIDLLVTPDPVFQNKLSFIPVFDYEQVLIVPKNHVLSNKDYVTPHDLIQETLITYPVDIERLDIYTQFLMPQNAMPKKRKIIETTDIMMQMVAARRGVVALPKWLALEYAQKMPIHTLRLGKMGIHKNIHLGFRETDKDIDYLASFIHFAKNSDTQ
jgi:LysR family transcriptional regulator, regulator for metE and metH